MHDQKFEKIFRPRPEDRQYGSNEPKKMRNPPGSFLNRAFLFKSYFIYIIDKGCIYNVYIHKAGICHYFIQLIGC